MTLTLLICRLTWVLTFRYLLPRSLFDEAEGEIWSSKKFSSRSDPASACPIDQFTVFKVLSFVKKDNFSAE